MVPTFLIIGAQKAATTTVWAWLREHPEVWVSDEKELHYFDRDHGCDDDEWYESQFREGYTAAGEATPSYCFHPDSLDNIHSYNPDFRLIMLLRDPAWRAVSHYWMEFWRGDEELPMVEAFKAEEGRIASSHKYSKAMRNYSYLARGRYHEQLDRIYALFPQEQVLVLTTDELAGAPLATMRAVTNFIGAPQWNDYSLTHYRVSDYPFGGAEEHDFLHGYFTEHNRILVDKFDVPIRGRWWSDWT